MYPGYRFMDSYPHQKNQYAPHYAHGFEGVPPQMKVDPVRSPINYESSPYGGSYSYPYPVEYHGCCHHNQLPGYHGFRPHYPHVVPHPSAHCCPGSFPPYPGAYPVHYIPSHYSWESPHYEYDKVSPGDPHCCGCPNHLYQQKEKNNVKIEEHNPDNEKKVDPSVPSELKNLSYPVVWIPPGWMSNKGGKQANEPESKEGDKHGHHDEKTDRGVKSSTEEPSAWNGWLPIDVNNLKSLMQGGEEKGTQLQHNQDNSKNLFPLFWMPHKPEQEEKMNVEDTNGNQKSAEEPLHFRASPLRLLDSQDKESTPKAHEENPHSEDGSKMAGKNVVQKIIPVKQMDETNEKVKRADSKGNGKPLETNGKRRSSTPKASKLPPVCLRVDPLPGRKNKNGRSRSPSPPNKRKSEESSHENSKSSSSSGLQGSPDMQTPVKLNRSKEGEKRSKTKTIEVVDGTIRNENVQNLKQAPSKFPVNVPVDSQEKDPISGTGDQSGKADEECNVKPDNGIRNDDGEQYEKVKEEKKVLEGQSVDGESESGGDGGAIKVNESGVHDINRAPDQKKLSDGEAAVLIQSVYRGYETRRLEPLKKLKEISKIKEQMTEVRSRVQDLIASGSWSDDKHKAVTGETIMSLLLKLDTIQGLHPSVRDVRKSVAKELVSLQEKLDSVTTWREEPSMEKGCERKQVEDISRSTSSDACIQSGPQSAEDRHEDETCASLWADLTKPCESRSLPVSNVNVLSVPSEKSDCGYSEEKFPEPELPSSVDSNELHTKPLTEPKDKPTTDLPDADQLPTLSLPENHDVLQVDSEKLPPPRPAEGNIDTLTESADLYPLHSGSIGTDRDMNDLVELSRGVIGHNFDLKESCDGVQINEERGLNSQDEPIMESSLVSPGDEVLEVTQSEQQPEVLLGECSDVSYMKDNVAQERDGEKKEELDGEAVLQPKPDQIGKEEDGGEIYESQEDGGDAELLVKGTLGSELQEISRAEDGDTNITPEAYGVEGNVRSVEDLETVDIAKHEMKDVIEETDGEKNEESALVLELQDITKGEDVANESPEVRSINSEPVVEDGDDTNKSSEAHTSESPEVHGVKRTGRSVEDMGMTYAAKPATEAELQPPELLLAEDNVCEEKEVATEETKECNMDPKILAVEGPEMQENMSKPDDLQQVTENDNAVDLETSEDGVLVGKELNGVEWAREESPGVAPTSDQGSSEAVAGSDRKLAEENEKLKEALEKLIEAGKEQLTAILSLSGRVKDLERKLSRKKKMKMRRPMVKV